MNENQIRIGIDFGTTSLKMAIFKGVDIFYVEEIKGDIDSLESIAKNALKDENFSNLSVGLVGVGASKAKNIFLGAKAKTVSEFDANGKVGKYFLGTDEDALVVSMGTGTSFIAIEKGNANYIGGLALGGGTIKGLSKYILGADADSVFFNASTKGKLENVNLLISDISDTEIPGLDKTTSASDFAKALDDASFNDKAAAIVNLILENVLQTASLIAKSRGIKNIVLIGGLTRCELLSKPMSMVSSLNKDITFVVDKNAAFGTAIGACL